MNRRIEAVLFSGGSGLTDEQRNIFYDAMKLILSNLTTYLTKQEEQQEAAK